MTTNKMHELLQEFDIKMDDRDRRDDYEDDEFEFDFDREEDPENGDQEFEFDVDSDEDDLDGYEDEFGLDSDDPEADEFPDGLDDVDDDDGEFGGERKIDITDRLKKMLSKRNGEDELDDDPELNLSDLDDLEGMDDRESDRPFRGHDRASMRDMDSRDGEEQDRPDRLGRVRRDRGRSRRGDEPNLDIESLRRRGD